MQDGFRSGNFNPRLREVGDVSHFEVASCYFISIHASAKEATERSACPIFRYYISIHASAKEATRIGGSDVGYLKISIHASAKEATLPRSSVFAGVRYFNPRLREGGDVVCRGSVQSYTNFNPRLREGGDRNAASGIQSNRISIHASAKEATGFC